MWGVCFACSIRHHQAHKLVRERKKGGSGASDKRSREGGREGSKRVWTPLKRILKRRMSFEKTIIPLVQASIYMFFSMEGWCMDMIRPLVSFSLFLIKAHIFVFQSCEQDIIIKSFDLSWKF